MDKRQQASGGGGLAGDAVVFGFGAGGLVGSGPVRLGADPPKVAENTVLAAGPAEALGSGEHGGEAAVESGEVGKSPAGGGSEAGGTGGDLLHALTRGTGAAKLAVSRAIRTGHPRAPHVTVDTANRFQGREFEIVIVVHPLSGRRYASAFHPDAGRLCVLTSRHRQGCIVVTHEGTVDSHRPRPPVRAGQVPRRLGKPQPDHARQTQPAPPNLMSRTTAGSCRCQTRAWYTGQPDSVSVPPVTGTAAPSPGRATAQVRIRARTDRRGHPGMSRSRVRTASPTRGPHGLGA
ncbi:AAA domain-containing protein [Kitasatospora sp. NPDC008115]|uniref:AAA domain-containing protein n=1 Tax=Kitasatospora sp. NPDC008115 TaxID=3364022 RepID=UPI0036E9B1C1